MGLKGARKYFWSNFIQSSEHPTKNYLVSYAWYSYPGQPTKPQKQKRLFDHISFQTVNGITSENSKEGKGLVFTESLICLSIVKHGSWIKTRKITAILGRCTHSRNTFSPYIVKNMSLSAIFEGSVCVKCRFMFFALIIKTTKTWKSNNSSQFERYTGIYTYFFLHNTAFSNFKRFFCAHNKQFCFCMPIRTGKMQLIDTVTEIWSFEIIDNY